MRKFKYDESFGGLVFDAPNGASFPVSAKATVSTETVARGRDALDGVMFTMRSEPVEHEAPATSDKLDGVMFTMRSEPVEQEAPATSDKLDGVMFTMRSEPVEQEAPATSDKLDGVMFTMRSEPVEMDCSHAA